MENDKSVVADTQNGAEEAKAPEGETAEQKLERLESTNRKLYERAKAAEGELKEIKPKYQDLIKKPVEKPTAPDEVTSRIDKLEISERKRQFGYRHNLSPDETDLLWRMSGDKTPDETLKEQDFQDVLESRRRRARVAEAIPSGTNRTVSVEGKSFKEMTPEERQKNWGKITGREK